jgi:hypothetical protein
MSALTKRLSLWKRPKAVVIVGLASHKEQAELGSESLYLREKLGRNNGLLE